MSEERPKVYLLDVEGTVAPLTLTTEVLFPYARAHFEAFLKRNVDAVEKKGESLAPADFGEGSVLWDLAMLRRENRAEADPDAPGSCPMRWPNWGWKERARSQASACGFRAFCNTLTG